MTGLRTRVGPVPAADTFALRQRVLRPHQSIAEMTLAGDEDPATVHLGAVDEEGEIVGVLRLQPARCPWAPERADGWQLRGMATTEQLRGQGVGSDLVAAAAHHVADNGGGLLWCNARVVAESFYARAGFRASHVRWDEPIIGPHVGMTLEVPPG